jgi:hypothetical protein
MISFHKSVIVKQSHPTLLLLGYSPVLVKKYWNGDKTPNEFSGSVHDGAKKSNNMKPVRRVAPTFEDP